ncbi:MAG: SDR family oxidoreductase [Lachnospiraceae bacterium]|nr:SDR family oxidoreductase [Lachnospiraceae bacterium]
MKLEGKTVLITGAGRGIGKAIALSFAGEGAKLVLAGRNEKTLNELRDSIGAFGGSAEVLVWDVSQVKDADRKIKEAAGFFGSPEIFVNNAGLIDHAEFLHVTEEDWDPVLDTNLKGCYFCCQAEINHLRENGLHGRIINIASETGYQPAPLPYSISKWGVVGLSMGLAKQVYRCGIAVSSIAPGPILTDMMGWAPGKDESFPNAFGTMARPEEVAEVALFLATSKTDRVIGRPVFVSGGLDW